MNIVERSRIIANPKYIEKTKIDSEKMTLAIKRGYKFNPDISDELFDSMMKMDIYVEKFKNLPEFKQKLKEAKEYTTIFKYVFDGKTEKFLDFYKQEIYSHYSTFRIIIGEKDLDNYIVRKNKITEIKEELFNNRNLINEVEKEILNNLQKYIPEIKEIEKLVTNAGNNFSQRFKEEYKKYVIADAKLDESTPDFLANDNEYITQCVINDPKSITKADKSIDIKSISDKIVQTIRKEQIVFDKIPYQFYYSKEIIFEIVKNNNELINNDEYLQTNYLQLTGKKSTLHEILEYSGYQITDKTPSFIFDDKEFVMNEIRRDFTITKYLTKGINLTEKEIKEIYNVYISQGEVTIRDSGFLKTNPLIIMHELNKGTISLDELNLKDIDNYYMIYNDLKQYIENNNIQAELPIPRTFNMNEPEKLIEINDETKTIVYGSANIESVQQLIWIRNNYFKDYKIVLFVSTPENIKVSPLIQEIKGTEELYFDFEQTKLFTLEQVIKDDEFLDYCVKDIKDSDMSEFEKYIAVYTIVKNIKEYKSEDRKTQTSETSRSVYAILNNNYIVCAGYANLMENLLKRVGINSKVTSVIAGDKSVTTPNHAIIAVELNDEKYGIKGQFLADPTNDNGKVNSYKLMLLYRVNEKNREYMSQNGFAFREEDQIFAINPDVAMEAIMAVKEKTFKNMTEEQKQALKETIYIESRFDVVKGEQSRKYRTKEDYETLFYLSQDMTLEEVFKSEDKRYILDAYDQFYRDKINNENFVVSYFNNENLTSLEIFYDLTGVQIAPEAQSYINKNQYEIGKERNETFITGKIKISPNMKISEIIELINQKKEELDSMFGKSLIEESEKSNKR